MIKIFNPDYYLETVFDLPVDELWDMGKKVLLIDLDNTLVPHDIKEATDDVFKFIETLKEKGFTPVIFSNNTHKRVERFSKDLGVEYYGSRRKPLLFKYHELIRKHGFDKNEIVAIGDQILTDVYGANRLGVDSVLIKPIAQRDILWTKANRIIENMVYNKLARKGLLKRGEYRGRN